MAIKEENRPYNETIKMKSYQLAYHVIESGLI